MNQYNLQGSSLSTFSTPEHALLDWSSNFATSAEELRILQQLRTCIRRIMLENMISGEAKHAKDCLQNFNLNICVDGKTITCRIGEGGPLLQICIFRNETPDKVVHFCSTIIVTSAKKTLILQKLRIGIIKIIQAKIKSRADKALLTNLILNIWVDGKITICKIGDGGPLLKICIGHEMSYKWID